MQGVPGLLAFILFLCLGCGEGEEVLDPGRERERKLIFEIWGSWWQDVYISFNIIVLKVDFIHFQFFTEQYRSSSFSFTNPLNVPNLNGDFIFPFSVTDPLQRPWYLGEKLLRKYLPSEEEKNPSCWKDSVLPTKKFKNKVQNRKNPELAACWRAILRAGCFSPRLLVSLLLRPILSSPASSVEKNHLDVNKNNFAIYHLHQ